MYAKLLTVSLAWVCFVASTAIASVVSVDPFEGSFSESWESFPTSSQQVSFLPDPSVIMAGAATIGNPLMTIYEPGVAGFGLGTSGSAQVADGAKGMGISGFDETATIIFSDALISFGAYWGAVTGFGGGDPALISISFFDELDELIGTDVIEYSQTDQGIGLLEWHGWTSAVPIKTISYAGDGVVIDGLQANPVPEPTTFVLIFMGGLMVLRRR